MLQHGREMLASCSGCCRWNVRWDYLTLLFFLPCLQAAEGMPGLRNCPCPTSPPAQMQQVQVSSSLAECVAVTVDRQGSEEVGVAQGVPRIPCCEQLSYLKLQANMLNPTSLSLLARAGLHTTVGMPARRRTGRSTSRSVPSSRGPSSEGSAQAEDYAQWEAASMPREQLM